ncbi:hypothetical protein F511_30809 [Dorcoceras hygrometricum]|uniref:Uncharacterized protein n=1 Tax=Dorcoceras hygrometricum TaxID=472368 RepID=A0A2Z7A4R2_9LAMI|nr:hypothetical protein F511_30809 [Dorcoceras hygrometricum]
MDRIGDYLPQSTEKSRVIEIPVGARHKCQQGNNNNNNNNSNRIQIPNTQKRGASPDLVHIINITETHGKGDRPAEPPLCPAWLPEDPANGTELKSTRNAHPKAHASRRFTDLTARRHSTSRSSSNR